MEEKKNLLRLGIIDLINFLTLITDNKETYHELPARGGTPANFG